MLVCYVDISGNTKASTDTIVASTIVIPCDTVRNVELKVAAMIDYIKLKYNITTDLELHAKDIVHGKHQWRRIPEHIRATILEGIIHVLTEYNDKILIISVVTRKTQKISIQNLHRYIFNAKIRLLLKAAEVFYGRPRYEHIYLIIVDKSIPAEEESIEGTVIDAVKSCHKSYCIDLCKIHVSFRDSKDCIGIQLADIVSYIVREIAIGRLTYRKFDFSEYFNKLTISHNMLIQLIPT